MPLLFVASQAEGGGFESRTLLHNNGKPKNNGLPFFFCAAVPADDGNARNTLILHSKGRLFIIVVYAQRQLPFAGKDP